MSETLEYSRETADNMMQVIDAATKWYEARMTFIRLASHDVRNSEDALKALSDLGDAEDKLSAAVRSL